jgi:hypothetical protein
MGFGGSFISLLMSKMMAKWSTGARIIEAPSNSTEFWLVETVRKQAEKAGIAMPEVAIYEGEPNAFATGPSKNNSLVAVSTGLLQGMSKEEVEAVLAHEVSHVANGDMVTLTLIQGVVNTFVIFLSRIVGYLVDSFLRKGDSESSGPGIGYTITVIVCDILFGILASVIVAWFSRQREYPRRCRRRQPDGFAAADDQCPGAPGRHERRAAAEEPGEFRHRRRFELDGPVRQPPEHGAAHRRAAGARPVIHRRHHCRLGPPRFAGAFLLFFAAAPAWAAGSGRGRHQPAVAGADPDERAPVRAAGAAHRLSRGAGRTAARRGAGQSLRCSASRVRGHRQGPDHRLHRRARRHRPAAADRPGDAAGRPDQGRPARTPPSARSASSCPSRWAPGWSGRWLLPGLSHNAYLFLGATLAATSVGITGRVFRDLGKLDSGGAHRARRGGDRRRARGW